VSQLPGDFVPEEMLKTLFKAIQNQREKLHTLCLFKREILMTAPYNWIILLL
jgi:hypothetical protein